ncbi:MAG: DUF3014 domain-containing protein [Congregibacter sp.]
MQADKHDRYTEGPNDNTGRRSTQTIITAIAVLILAGGAYLLAPKDDSTPAMEPIAEPVEPKVAAAPPQPEVAPKIVAAADIPPKVDAEPAPTMEPEVVAAPPPTPEEIDTQLREGIAATELELTEPLQAAYRAPYLLDRGMSSIDQIARGLVPTRSLNLSPPAGSFKVSSSGQQRFLDTATYARYDAIVAAVTALPTQTLADLFHRFRPQLENAYASLGYPAEQMDNTLVAALEQVISAPIMEGTPELETKGALYAYVDPELEGASDIHKQLMRAGPENTRRLQQWAKDLSDQLLK